MSVFLVLRRGSEIIYNIVILLILFFQKDSGEIDDVGGGGGGGVLFWGVRGNMGIGWMLWKDEEEEEEERGVGELRWELG